MLCDDVCHVPHQPLLITSPPQASKLPITIQASGHHDFEDNDDDDDDEDDDNDDDDDEDDDDDDGNDEEDGDHIYATGFKASNQDSFLSCHSDDGHQHPVMMILMTLLLIMMMIIINHHDDHDFIS